MATKHYFDVLDGDDLKSFKLCVNSLMAIKSLKAEAERAHSTFARRVKDLKKACTTPSSVYMEEKLGEVDKLINSPSNVIEKNESDMERWSLFVMDKFNEKYKDEREGLDFVKEFKFLMNVATQTGIERGGRLDVGVKDEFHGISSK